jgi:hypothetical protein
MTVQDCVGCGKPVPADWCWEGRLGCPCDKPPRYLNTDPITAAEMETGLRDRYGWTDDMFSDGMRALLAGIATDLNKIIMEQQDVSDPHQ